MHALKEFERGSEVEADVRAIVLEAIGDADDREIANDTDLELLGVSSLKFLRIISRLEKKYGVEIDDSRVIDLRCIRDMAACIATLLAQQTGE